MKYFVFVCAIFTVLSSCSKGSQNHSNLSLGNQLKNESVSVPTFVPNVVPPYCKDIDLNGVSVNTSCLSSARIEWRKVKTPEGRIGWKDNQDPYLGQNSQLHPLVWTPIAEMQISSCKGSLAPYSFPGFSQAQDDGLKELFPNGTLFCVEEGDATTNLPLCHLGEVTIALKNISHKNCVDLLPSDLEAVDSLRVDSLLPNSLLGFKNLKHLSIVQESNPNDFNGAENLETIEFHWFAKAGNRIEPYIFSHLNKLREVIFTLSAGSYVYALDIEDNAFAGASTLQTVTVDSACSGQNPDLGWGTYVFMNPERIGIDISKFKYDPKCWVKRNSP